eukprot:scaffold7326_cov39-Prasinocladus_malaysianus.AAC.3
MEEKIGQADTVQQLKVMVATLQKEISMLQSNNTKLKSSQAQLDDALAQAEAARTAQHKLVGTPTVDLLHMPCFTLSIEA